MPDAKYVPIQPHLFTIPPFLRVVREFSFDAAHFLPGYEGKCANLHGHRWVLQVGVTAQVDKETGMVMDFKELQAVVQKHVIEQLDHTCLNDVDVIRSGFPTQQPTAERILWWAVQCLMPLLPSLSFVRLYESPGSYVEWVR